MIGNALWSYYSKKNFVPLNKLGITSFEQKLTVQKVEGYYIRKKFVSSVVHIFVGVFSFALTLSIYLKSIHYKILIRFFTRAKTYLYFLLTLHCIFSEKNGRFIPWEHKQNFMLSQWRGITLKAMFLELSPFLP